MVRTTVLIIKFLMPCASHRCSEWDLSGGSVQKSGGSQGEFSHVFSMFCWISQTCKWTTKEGSVVIVSNLEAGLTKTVYNLIVIHQMQRLIKLEPCLRGPFLASNLTLRCFRILWTRKHQLETLKAHSEKVGLMFDRYCIFTTWFWNSVSSTSEAKTWKNTRKQNWRWNQSSWISGLARQGQTKTSSDVTKSTNNQTTNSITINI